MRLFSALMIALALGAAAQAGPRSPESLARLEAALREHPLDPALARALAKAQLDAGQPDAALATIAQQLARAPEQSGALAQLRGRALYAKGELRSARAALREAIAHRRRDALAHFYLGLTEQRLGDRVEAERELARARELDPELESRARAFALPAPTALERAAARVAVFGATALDYDSNASLESEEGTTAGDDSSGLRIGYQGGIAAQLVASEDARVALSYRYDASDPRAVDGLDLASHGVALTSAYAPTPRWVVRLDGGAGFYRLDGERYLDDESVALSLGRRGDSGGLWELLALAERRDFADPPPLPSLARDGWRVGTSLRHALGFRWGVPARLTAQLGYARTSTDGSRDSFGFGPAYDSHAGFADVALRLALPFSFRLDAQVGFTLEQFDARNVIDFLSDPTATPTDAHRRRDRVVGAGLAVARPLGRWLELELHARETRHYSNVDFYDWERQIVGTTLRVFWQPRSARSMR
jgi:Flp pilus assembly protein TadD